MSKRNRGFASMDPEYVKKIASMGGKAAHKSGRAHEWNAEEAAEAGRLGGKRITKAELKKRAIA